MEYPWRRAIVIGASSGMGREMARKLLKDGCRVALVARRADELENLKQETRDEKGESKAIVACHDVTHIEAVGPLFQELARELGGLDLLVFAAGTMPRITSETYDSLTDRSTVEVNLIGAIAWINEAALRFGRAGEGTIVAISSVAGDRGRGGQPAYAAAKAGLATYMESIRNRVGALGVSVVTVKPGPVSTPMTKGIDGLPLIISSERAAKEILAGAARKRRVVYVPGIWRPIMFLVRTIPSFIFQRMKKFHQ